MIRVQFDAFYVFYVFDACDALRCCQEDVSDNDVDEATFESVMDAARTWTKAQARPTIK